MNQGQRRARIHQLRLEEGARKAAEELEKCKNTFFFFFLFESIDSKAIIVVTYTYLLIQMIQTAIQISLEIHTRHCLLLGL